MRLYPFLPGVILKYKFETYKFIQRVEVPIYIFHGNVDELIDYESSVKLQKYFKPGDQLIMLEGQGHNGINENYQFRTEMNNLLGD